MKNYAFTRFIDTDQPTIALIIHILTKGARAPIWLIKMMEIELIEIERYDLH